MKPDEIVNAQLAELLGKYGTSEENQKDLNLVRRIAEIYEQIGDLQNALEWFNYASALTNHTDHAVARKASEIELRILDRSIAEFESWLGQYGNAENGPEVRRQLEELKELKARRIIKSQPKATPWATNGPDQVPKIRHGPW